MGVQIMNREILFNYFEGLTTPDQERDIMEWANSSTENYKIYLEERQLWVAIMLHSDNSQRVSFQSVRRPLRRVAAIAATVALFIAISLGIYGVIGGAFTQTQTITVPSGQRIELTLADGTHIWLNSKSRLEYSSLFGIFTRKLRLSGEGYFEVAKNRLKPFVVTTRDYDIEVLGTTFNVYAFDDGNHFETTLLEGSLKISSHTNYSDRLTLKPNQIASATQGQSLACTQMSIDDTDRLRWREGIICMNNVTFGELLERLSTYYDINIYLNNPKLYDIRCTGKFRQSDGIDYSLSVLQNLVNFSFTHNSTTNAIYIE